MITQQSLKCSELNVVLARLTRFCAYFLFKRSMTTLVQSQITLTQLQTFIQIHVTQIFKNYNKLQHMQ